MGIKELVNGRSKMIAFRHRVRQEESKKDTHIPAKEAKKGTGDTLEEEMKNTLLLRPATRVVPEPRDVDKFLSDEEVVAIAKDPLKRRKRGRPPKYENEEARYLSERRTVTLGVSVSRKEEVLLKRFAEDEGKSFSTWAREILFASKGYKVPHRVSAIRGMKKSI